MGRCGRCEMYTVKRFTWHYGIGKTLLCEPCYLKETSTWRKGLSKPNVKETN